MQRLPTETTKAAERANVRQARLVAIVLAATMVLWMGAQVLGGRLGLEARYAFLFDFAAIAALIWALVVTWAIWRRQTAGDK